MNLSFGFVLIILYPFIFSLLLLLFFSFIVTAILRRFIAPLKDKRKLSNFLSSLIAFTIFLLLSSIPIKNLFDSFAISSLLVVAITVLLAFSFTQLTDRIDSVGKKKICFSFILILVLLGFFYPRENGYTHHGDPYVLQKKSCRCVGFKAFKADIDSVIEYCLGIPSSCILVNEPKLIPDIGVNPPQTIEENYCGADKRYYDTNISKCFGETTALIGILSSEDKNGENIYFLDNPQWGDRSRLNTDGRKIFIEFQKEINIQHYLKSQVRLTGKVDNREPTPFKCTGAPTEQIIWSEKYPDGYCLIKDEPWKIIIEVDQVERYTPPETWVWVDGSKDYLPKLKSKTIVNEEITKTARFTPIPGILSLDPDCLFLDDPNINKKFKEIVFAGTEHGSYDEYLISNIEMTASGPLERRVYDYGVCPPPCPPNVDCKRGPCGEQAFECLNPKTLERKNDDGIRYGVNWFSGYITHPGLKKDVQSPYTDLQYFLQNYNVPIVKVKDDTGKIISTYENMMFLHSVYRENWLYQIGFDYVLVLKNNNLYLTREDVFDHQIKLKVYGEKGKAEYCVRPLKGSENCYPKSLILVEKIIDEKGENIISTR